METAPLRHLLASGTTPPQAGHDLGRRGERAPGTPRGRGRVVCCAFGNQRDGHRLAVDADITLRVDGEAHGLTVDTRTTLLDALRERLGNTSPKKGCDHGQCGACTILLDGERALSCLALAVAHDGAEITTADGLATDGQLHPVQQSFIDHDAFQCGYCTPGQVCSAVGALQELERGWPSHVTGDVTATPELTDAEISERMSGNLCRCGAYANITPAVKAAGGVR